MSRCDKCNNSYCQGRCSPQEQQADALNDQTTALVEIAEQLKRIADALENVVKAQPHKHEWDDLKDMNTLLCSACGATKRCYQK